jgi:predicted site-specific integrase-resolvase|tara:strand:+ start:570 stop:779 length:210 start_codon:yes stop_codon:yes gene_type:complete
MEKEEIAEKLSEIMGIVNEPFITEKELSEKIGVSKVSLHNWRKKGRIPYYKLGQGLIRYKLSEVMKRIN